jgi:hypothetical protein
MDEIDEALIHGLTSVSLSGIPGITLPDDSIKAYRVLDYYYCYATVAMTPAAIFPGYGDDGRVQKSNPDDL